MGFPYTFPFTFSIKRLLRLLFKKSEDLTIKPLPYVSGLTIRGRCLRDHIITSEKTSGLQLLVRAKPNHNITSILKGGG